MSVEKEPKTQPSQAIISRIDARSRSSKHKRKKQAQSAKQLPCANPFYKKLKRLKAAVQHPTSSSSQQEQTNSQVWLSLLLIVMLCMAGLIAWVELANHGGLIYG